MRAHFMINGMAKLRAYAPNVEPNDLVVCDASMDTTVIRQYLGMGPLLFAYFNADSVPLYGETNPYYQGLRSLMLKRTYNPQIFDPPYTNAPLIRPTFGAADDYADWIVKHVENQGWDGAYLDQSWKTKPDRFVLWESPHYITNRTQAWANQQVRDRWEAYIEMLVELVTSHITRVMLNCAADPPWQYRAPGIHICRESNPNDWLLDYAKLITEISPSGYLSAMAPGVLWNCGPDAGVLQDLIIEGCYVPDVSGNVNGPAPDGGSD